MSFERLRKIAIYGAVASISGSFILHHIIQGNLASGDYYKLTLDAVRQHKETNKIFGSPLKFQYMNLARKDIRITREKAQIVVPLRGTMKKGNVFSTSFKSGNKWWLDQVEVRDKDNTSKITVFSNNHK